MRSFALFVAVTCGSALGWEANAQIVIRDQNGPNLYIAGTPGDDVVFVWENAGDLLVAVNGQLTNVTAETGVTAAMLHCVGTNLFGGDDFVSYEMLPATAGGTTTNGGVGRNEVLMGDGSHNGSSIDSWTQPVKEAVEIESTPTAAPDAPTEDGYDVQPLGPAAPRID